MIRIGVLTVSDRSARGEREDRSGPLLAELAARLPGAVIEEQAIVPDDAAALQAILRRWADDLHLDLILTTGGTGFAPRDVTPEATLAVVDRLAPGFAEAMRAVSLQITPHAMLSRAVAGIRGQTLIVNMPGSPRSVRENFAVIVPALPHAVQLLQDAPDAEAHHHFHGAQVA